MEDKVRRVVSINIDHKEIYFDGMDWIGVAQDWASCQSLSFALLSSQVLLLKIIRAVFHGILRFPMITSGLSVLSVTLLVAVFFPRFVLQM
jgi:hypothetical protein